MTPPQSFLTELERLEKEATKGPWMIYDSCSWRRIGLVNDHKEILYPCNSRSDGHPDIGGANRDDDLALLMFLRNHSRAIADLVRAAEDLETWLGKTVGSNEDAQVEILATDIGAEGTSQRLQRLADALAALNGGQQEDKA